MRAPFREQLIAAERRNHSMLCVGLDPDPARFPGAWRGDASRIHDFCAAIVEATAGLVVAFKPQIAYFAAHRAEDQLEELMSTIRRVAPDVPVILDAKRGDIGATAEQYAREAFERYQVDAVTLSPFMGPDTIEPFLRYDGKGVFLLDWTSNLGSAAIQGREVFLTVEEMKAISDHSSIYLTEQRLPLHDFIAYEMSRNWGISPDRLGLVVGATHPGGAKGIRQFAGTGPAMLIPGIGAQGGSVEDAMAAWCGPGSVVVNNSRGILYAGNDEYFANAAQRAAMATRDQLWAARPNYA